MRGSQGAALALAAVGALLVAQGAAAAPARDWPQQMVGATAAAGLDGSGIVVAVLDSGIDHTHPDLAGRFWSNPLDPPNDRDDDLNGLVDDSNGWDYCHDDAPREVPGYFHGTFVAGVLAGTGAGGGVRGAAPGVQIMDVQVYCDNDEYPATNPQPTSPQDYMDRDSLRAGLKYAIDHGADVIVMSLQLWADQPEGFVAALLPTDEEFQAAHDAGIVLVGAAGNRGQAGPEQPGAQPHVLTVGATTGCGFRHGFSNFGPGIDIWAPGRAYGPVFGGGHAWKAGTSFAAPLVAGAAALLLQKEPGLGPDEVAARLIGAAAPSEDGPVLDLHGLLGIERAAGSARLDLVGATAVDGPHYLQYQARGDEASLLDIRAEGYGAWCKNLADDDPANETFYVAPSQDEALQVGARLLGATWQGPWLNRTFTYDGDATPAGPRPVLVHGAPEPGGPGKAPLPWALAPLALALAAARRRR